MTHEEMVKKDKRKLCILVCFSLVLSMGCYAILGKLSDNNETTRIEYDVDENGNIIANGKISYEELTTKYKLFKLEDLSEKNRFIIGYYNFSIFNEPITDIENGKKITLLQSNIEVINSYYLNDILFTFDEVKEEYDIDDINRILSKIEELYESNKIKKLENTMDK